MLLRMVTAFGFSMLINNLLSTWFSTFYESNRTLCILMIIWGCFLLGKQPQWVMITVAVLSGIGIMISPSTRVLLPSYSFGFVLSGCVALLMGVLTRTMRKSNYQEIAPGQLVAGMVLSAYTYTRFPNPTLLSQDRWVESRRSRLNQEQADAVRAWALRKKEPVLIVRMIPFAPFIAAGTVLELLLGWFRVYR